MTINVRKYRWLDEVNDALRWIAVIGGILVSLVFFIRGCSGDADHARTLIESSGFRDVNIGGPSRWSCGGDDTFSNTFTARGGAGRRVEGVVCCGFLTKACTIRFD